ncbi:MAG: response regulator [Treponema sp.]|nr:response regulator [Treponema sp.]
MYNLLLVDDEKLEREALTLFTKKSSLAAKFSAIEQCANGNELVKKVPEFKPDIIILDIKMPGLNGLEALQKLREDGSDAVVIISSAYNQFDFAVKAMQLGVINFLVKPVKEAVFVEALGQAVSVLEKSSGATGEPNETGGKTKQFPESVQKICKYIEENYKKPINLDDIAEHCSYSRYHISHIFHDVSGFTVFSYLLEVRMQKAKELLQNSSLSIKEISHEIGFSDQNYFSNVFKRQIGLSPVEFRTKFRKIF